MNKTTTFITVLLLLAIAAGGGYWLGAGRSAQQAVPDAGAKGEKGERKPLYYRNPMGLPDTSPVPKKDSMGMDYIPVYAGEEPAGPDLKISLDRVQKLGVKTEAVTRREFSRTVRAVGTVQVNERMERTVAPKFEGWIQKLLVATTGEAVRRGQPLMEVYSPDLVTAQQEYLIAMRGSEGVKDAAPDIQAGMKRLAENGLLRLRNWDISDEELQRLQQEGKPRNTITLRSPVDGVVLGKPPVQGMRFMPGEALYRIADLSSLWLLAEIYEQDLAWVAPGQEAVVRVNAYADKVFRGKVAFVYPTVTPESRTARVRIELPNPGRLLKPDMYASVELALHQRGGKALTVSDSAVIDSGTRQIVLVQREEGRFDPREVRLGQRSDGYVEVLDGLKEGERVVVSANFLIDAESNLKAAVSGFGAGQAPAAASAAKHDAVGQVQSVDAKAGEVMVAHEPVTSLNWPAMTMAFKVRDAAMLARIKAGDRIRFEFAEQPAGEWTVLRVEPVAAAPAVRAPVTRAAPEKATSPGTSKSHDHQGH